MSITVVSHQLVQKMTQFKITEADVRNLANSQSFDRGYRYYRSQAVANVVRRGSMRN